MSFPIHHWFANTINVVVVFSSVRSVICLQLIDAKTTECFWDYLIRYVDLLLLLTPCNVRLSFEDLAEHYDRLLSTNFLNGNLVVIMGPILWCGPDLTISESTLSCLRHSPPLHIITVCTESPWHSGTYIYYYFPGSIYQISTNTDRARLTPLEDYLISSSIYELSS